MFDSAVQCEEDLRVDLDYIAKEPETSQRLNQIRLITILPASGKFDYKKIPDLNELMSKVKEAHGAMLDEKNCTPFPMCSLKH